MKKITIYTNEEKAKEKILSVIPDAYCIFDTGDKPKSADEMFKELGYEKTVKPADDTFGYCKYEHNSEQYKIEIGKAYALIEQGYEMTELTFPEVKAVAKYIEENE